jgi:tRNA(Ile)-lysidine synthase
MGSVDIIEFAKSQIRRNSDGLAADRILSNVAECCRACLADEIKLSPTIGSAGRVAEIGRIGSFAKISAGGECRVAAGKWPAGRVCLACSGGSDSIFLLEYILREFCDLKNALVVLHYNHDLRGAESDGDEIFVKEIAAAMGVEFYSERLACRPKSVTEASLRQFRNDFFERAMAKFGAKILLLGHQKNDVCETVLMRLMRGSGTAGLSAPRAVTIFKNYVKLRPLLKFTKSEIESKLVSLGIRWRDDGTNFENNFLRNKIRNTVIPQLQKSADKFDIFNGFVAAQGSICEAEDAVNFFAEIYFNERMQCGGGQRSLISAEDLRNFPTAVSKKICVKFLEANGLAVRRTNIDFFLQNLDSIAPAVRAVGIGKFVEFDGSNFRLTAAEESENFYEISLKIGENRLPTGKTLTVENVKISNFSMEIMAKIDRARQCYVAVAAGTEIVARNYRPNFRYAPIGHRRNRKIGDLLTAKVLAGDDKKAMPVVVAAGSVCWVPHLPVADFFKIKNGDGCALLLTYR